MNKRKGAREIRWNEIKFVKERMKRVACVRVRLVLVRLGKLKQKIEWRIVGSLSILLL